MHDKNALLRTLPQVEELLEHPSLQPALTSLPRQAVVDAARSAIDDARQALLAGNASCAPSAGAIAQSALLRTLALGRRSLRRVVNASGVIVHTNLGRSPLAASAIEAVNDVIAGYSTLEYDTAAMARGSRHAHCEQLICALTGAQAAIAVNNNAAAVMMVLSQFAAGWEAVVSRGEEVEIGGSFRIPEIMEQCGCSLREVGATNKTHLRDYENAIGEGTRALLKVHTSNYRILGFSESVPLQDLVALGRKHSLPVIEDLGSGCFFDLERIGIHGEPTVMDSVRAGVDIISFSGDKLLGGPQAGIILGSEEWIARLKTHPLTRAMRVDKMTLAALEATLQSYLDPEKAREEIPTLRMLSIDPARLKLRAELLRERLEKEGVLCEVVPEQDQVGGGSVPTQLLPTWAVAVTPRNLTVDGLEERLRTRSATPIIGRIAHERYLLDVRTLWEEDFALIAASVAEADR